MGPGHRRMLRKNCLKQHRSTISFAGCVCIGSVDLTFRQLLCESMEGGMAQAEARIMMLNVLEDVEGEKGRSAWTDDPTRL